MNHVLFRHHIIDDCFHKDLKKQWTLKELEDTINVRLLADNRTPIAKRTLQNDLDELRAKGAPIESFKIGYQYFFHYTDATFSVKKQPISERDKRTLQEAASLLSQFKELPHYQALQDTLLQIDCWIDGEVRSLIQFDSNEYQGYEHLPTLYEAVKNRKALRIKYQDFEQTEGKTYTMHPYFMKEYRNRWYVVGQVDNGSLYNLALDRIKDIHVLEFMPFVPSSADFVAETHFQDVIGVTIYKAAPTEKIVFKVHKSSANYVKTKKLHASQIIVEETLDFTVFALQVKINYELKAELLRFGAALEVLEPMGLRNEFKEIFESLVKLYILETR